jgi:hypothetical protein
MAYRLIRFFSSEKKLQEMGGLPGGMGGMGMGM